MNAQLLENENKKAKNIFAYNIRKSETELNF